MGLLVHPDGDADNSPSAGLQDAVEFAQRSAIILDVFQDMNADDGIEALRKKGGGHKIHFDSDVRTIRDIHAHVIEVTYLLETPGKAVLGRNMEQAQRVGKQVRPLFKEEPYPPVPRLGMAARAIAKRPDSE